MTISTPRQAPKCIPEERQLAKHTIDRIEYHMASNFSMTVDHFACDTFNVSVVLWHVKCVNLIVYSCNRLIWTSDMCNVNWSLCRMREHHWWLLVEKATQQLLNCLPVKELMWMILTMYVSSVIEFIFTVYMCIFPLMIWCLYSWYGDSFHGDISNIHVYMAYKNL